MREFIVNFLRNIFVSHFFFLTPAVYVLYKAAIEALWHLLSEDQMLNVKILGSLFSSLSGSPLRFLVSAENPQLSKNKKMADDDSYFFLLLFSWLDPPFISFFFLLLVNFFCFVCSCPPGWERRIREKIKFVVWESQSKWRHGAPKFLFDHWRGTYGPIHSVCVEQSPLPFPLMDLSTLFFFFHPFLFLQPDDNEGQVNQRYS